VTIVIRIAVIKFFIILPQPAKQAEA